jgi:hypothetical protein
VAIASRALWDAGLPDTVTSDRVLLIEGGGITVPCPAQPSPAHIHIHIHIHVDVDVDVDVHMHVNWDMDLDVHPPLPGVPQQVVLGIL